jgi:SAM-dependent methyltransferase
MNTPIQPYNQSAANVWDAGGADYDEISRHIADSIEHCVLRLDPQPRERILDLGTGTGWTSRSVARRGATVVGVDFGRDLIAAASERARAEALNIDYRVGDAENLPFADGEFDAVISTFGVMFTSRPEAAAAELSRVCRSGGRVALTTWLPNGNVHQVFLIMQRFMSLPLSTASPSPFDWGRVDRVRELLGEAFNVKFESGTTWFRERDGKTAWDTFSKGFGPTKALVSSLDDTRRAELARDFIAFHEGFRNELGISMPREYWVTLGVRQ